MKTTTKILLILFFALFCAGTTMNAQVRIGENATPRTGTLLDLKSTFVGGLLLPNVNIDDLSKIPAGFTDAAVQSQDTNDDLKGMIVYNTNASIGEGVYVWDGNDWKNIGTDRATPAADTYYITGINCFDVAQTLSTECGTTGRTNAFLSTKAFQYTLEHTTVAANVTFAVQDATGIVKSLTWTGDVATIVFVDDIVERITGNATGNTIKLYALFTDNTSANVQTSMTITVKDCTCCPGYLQPGSTLCWYKTDEPGKQPWNASGIGPMTINCNSAVSGSGMTGWRVPRIDELSSLQSIFNNLEEQPSSDIGTTNLQPSWYWSDTSEPDGVWGWYFGSSGVSGIYTKTANLYVRCVKSNN